MKLFRHYQTYYPIVHNEIKELSQDVFAYYKKYNLDIIKEICLDDLGQHYIDNVLNLLFKKGVKHFI